MTYSRAEIDRQMRDPAGLSSRLGCHRNTIMSWRRGDAEPSLSMGLRLAEELKIPATVLAIYFSKVRAERRNPK